MRPPCYSDVSGLEFRIGFRLLHYRWNLRKFSGRWEKGRFGENRFRLALFLTRAMGSEKLGDLFVNIVCMEHVSNHCHRVNPELEQTRSIL